MKNMTSITIDPFTGNAVIETGNRIEDIAIKLSHAGRGLGHGSCPGVGIGGHAGNFPISSTLACSDPALSHRLRRLRLHIAHVGSDFGCYRIHQRGAC